MQIMKTQIILRCTVNEREQRGLINQLLNARAGRDALQESYMENYGLGKAK